LRIKEQETCLTLHEHDDDDDDDDVGVNLWSQKKKHYITDQKGEET